MFSGETISKEEGEKSKLDPYPYLKRAKTNVELGLEPAKTKKRKERIPFGTIRQKLNYKGRAGKVSRWVNDVGGRCQLAEDGGYSFVTDNDLKIGDTDVGSGNQSLDTRVSRIVGTLADGSPQRAFLMEIDEEVYKDDQKEKQKKIDLIDDQIQRGNIEGRVGLDGRYIPKEGINYKP